MLEPPWRDPKTDPPEEYTEVIVTTEVGRVTSLFYYKGRFSGSYVPVIAWQPMPKPAKIKKEKETKTEKVEETPKPKSKAKPKGAAVAKRKTKA